MKSQNIKVAILPSDIKNRNYYIPVAIKYAFQRRSDVDDVYMIDYLDGADVCRLNKVDILVVVGGAGASLNSLVRIIASARISILWTTEDPYELKRNQEIGIYFDHIFTNDISCVGKFPNSKATYLPLAASRDFHQCRQKNNEKLFDVFFVGTGWPNRVVQINELLAYLPSNLKLKFGISGNPYIPTPAFNSFSLITDFRVAPQEFARLASQSRIVLTLDRDFSTASPDQARGFSPPPRLFEVGVTGTPQVFISNTLEMHNFYKDGKDIALAQDMYTAANQIKSLIADPSKAHKMGQSALDITLSSHMYENRVDTIIEKCASYQEHKPAYIKNVSTNKRKRILTVAHNSINKPPFGGVEVYKDVVEKSLDEFDFWEVFPDESKNLLILQHQGQKIDFSVSKISEFHLFDHSRESVFQNILIDNKIDLVHYHHLLGGGLFAFPLISRALGIPSVFTAHDYFMICHQFTLINHNGLYCGVSNPNTSMCDICLSVRGIASPGSQSRRREISKLALENTDAIFYNTQFSSNKFFEIFGKIKTNSYVIGMTGSPKTLKLIELNAKRTRLTNDFEQTKPLNVSILGNFATQKGGHLIVEMLFQLMNQNIKIYIDGRIDDEFSKTLQYLSFPNVVIRGIYSGFELPERLENIDVSIHYSIWPETYCIAIDEVRAAGVVPIALAYGALRERVRNGIDGFSIEPSNPYELISLLIRLSQNREELDALRVKSAMISENSLNHLNNLRQHYSKLISSKPVKHAMLSYKNDRLLYSEDLGIRVNHPCWNSEDILLDKNDLFSYSKTLLVEQQLVPSGTRPVEISNGSERVLGNILDTAKIEIDELEVNLKDVCVINLSNQPFVIRISLSCSAARDIFAISFVGKQRNQCLIQKRETMEPGDQVVLLARIDLSEAPLESMQFALEFKDEYKTWFSRLEIYFIPPNLNASDNLINYNLLRENFKKVKVTSKINRNQPTIEKRSKKRFNFRKIFRFEQLAMGNLDTLGEYFWGPGSNFFLNPQDQKFIMTGWILSKDLHSLENVSVLIVPDSGLKFEFPAVAVERPDVVAHFGTDTARMSGFIATIKTESFGHGKMNISVRGLSQKKKHCVLKVGTVNLLLP